MPTACHDGCTLRTTFSRCSRLVIQIVKPYTPQPLGGVGKDRLGLCRRCAPSSSGIGSVSGKDGVHLSWGARWGKKKKPAYPLGACRLLYHIFFIVFNSCFHKRRACSICFSTVGILRLSLIACTFRSGTSKL